jgi:hypothetical protein
MDLGGHGARGYALPNRPDPQHPKSGAAPGQRLRWCAHQRPMAGLRPASAGATTALLGTSETEPARHCRRERPRRAPGELGVQESRRLFGLWYQHRRGEISRAELRRAMVPVRMRVRRLLRCAAASEDRRARSFGRDLLRHGRNLLLHLTAAPTAHRHGHASPALPPTNGTDTIQRISDPPVSRNPANRKSRSRAITVLLWPSGTPRMFTSVPSGNLKTQGQDARSACFLLPFHHLAVQPVAA